MIQGEERTMVIRLLRDAKLMLFVAFGEGVVDAELYFVCVPFSTYSLEFLDKLVVTCSLFLNEFPELGVLCGERVALADCLLKRGKLWILGG